MEDEQLAFKPIVDAEPEAIDIDDYSVEAYNEYIDNDGQTQPDDEFDFQQIDLTEDEE